MLAKIFGWHALLLIAGAVALAELLKGHALLRKGLWGLAAAFAVVGAFNSWRSK